MSSDKFDRKSEELEIDITYSFGAARTPYGVIRKTRKNRKDKIQDFIAYLTVLSFFPLNMKIFFPLYTVFNKPKLKKFYLGKKRPQRTHDDELYTLLSYNEVMSPTADLCMDEFVVFLSELQVAGYSGAARTLRYILETAVEACEFQTERNRPTFGMLVKEHISFATLSKKKRKLRSLFIRYNALASFIERYKIYEKTKRIAPSFRELVNSLNSRQIFEEVPLVSDELKVTYSVLSDYVHPSLTKFEKIMEKEGSPHGFSRFSSKEFDTIYELGVKTLDIVQFLYLKSIAFFFDYKTVKEFLRDLAKLVSFKSKREISFLALPLSKRVSEGIQWRVAKGRKRKKSEKGAKNKAAAQTLKPAV